MREAKRQPRSGESKQRIVKPREPTAPSGSAPDAYSRHVAKSVAAFTDINKFPTASARWPIFMRRGPRIEVDLENFALELAGTLADNEQCAQHALGLALEVLQPTGRVATAAPA